MQSRRDRLKTLIGIETRSCAIAFLYFPRRDRLKTLIGIETSCKSYSPEGNRCRDRLKTLIGIETSPLTASSRVVAIVAIGLKPL